MLCDDLEGWVGDEVVERLKREVYMSCREHMILEAGIALGEEGAGVHRGEKALQNPHKVTTVHWESGSVSSHSWILGDLGWQLVGKGQGRR